MSPPVNATQTHLLIADDHPLIRSGMRAQLEPLGGSGSFPLLQRPVLSASGVEQA